MFTEAQKEILTEVILEKMKKNKKAQVKIPKLMDFVSKKVGQDFYIKCEYPEDYVDFKNVFEEACIKKSLVPGKTFSLSESGFLDGKGRYPTDTYGIVQSHPSGKKSLVVGSTIDSGLTS